MNPTYSSPPPSTSAVTALAPGCGRDVTASPHDRHRCRSQPTPPGRPQQRPPPDRGQCHGLGDPHRSSCDVQFHALRTRHAGRRAFISIHVLVPGGWTVLEGHDLAEDVEAALHEICRTRPCSGQPEPAEAPRSLLTRHSSADRREIVRDQTLVGGASSGGLPRSTTTRVLASRSRDWLSGRRQKRS